MNDHPTRTHRQISSVTDVTWAVAGVTRVTLSVTGKTPTSGWTDFLLVPSGEHPSEPKHFHFDAWGLPPEGENIQVETEVSFRHTAPAGEYDVTVYGKNGSAATHVNYPLGDDRG